MKGPKFKMCDSWYIKRGLVLDILLDTLEMLVYMLNLMLICSSCQCLIHSCDLISYIRLIHLKYYVYKRKYFMLYFKCEL